MRIISGKFKGRRLTAPKNLPVRPTTDMSKEALFNVLNNYFSFDGLKVLDLFAGTGNISYEFGSRGSDNITCVDGDFGCVKYIKQVAQEFDFNIAAIRSDVFRFLEKSNSSYDIIFADPPYNLPQAEFEKIVLLIFEREMLHEDGMMVIEHSKHTKLDHMIHFSFKKNYGGSVFSFFEISDDETTEAGDETDVTEEG